MFPMVHAAQWKPGKSRSSEWKSDFKTFKQCKEEVLLGLDVGVTRVVDNLGSLP